MADKTLPYDFCLPIDISRLENDRMKLMPMEVSAFSLSQLKLGLVLHDSVVQRFRRPSCLAIMARINIWGVHATRGLLPKAMLDQ